jgi:hypothetical protein
LQNIYSLHIHLLGGEVDAGRAHEHDHAADDDHHGHDLKHTHHLIIHSQIIKVAFAIFGHLRCVQSNWAGKHLCGMKMLFLNEARF